mmetsp:Transcript_118013/g.186946  ORF Transcript_118013/g.186946 Transcript_118013/m.186946 type:complete len:107 (+) Transcript_118013:84-404(+)
MGRSAKLVRNSAFEKQKRTTQGKEWRKGQWKEAREKEKLEKRTKANEAGLEVAPGAEGVEKGANSLAKPKKDLKVSFDGDVDMNAEAQPPREKFTRSKKKSLILQK